MREKPTQKREYRAGEEIVKMWCRTKREKRQQMTRYYETFQKWANIATETTDKEWERDRSTWAHLWNWTPNSGDFTADPTCNMKYVDINHMEMYIIYIISALWCADVRRAPGRQISPEAECDVALSDGSAKVLTLSAGQSEHTGCAPRVPQGPVSRQWLPHSSDLREKCSLFSGQTEILSPILKVSSPLWRILYEGVSILKTKFGRQQHYSKQGFIF